MHTFMKMEPGKGNNDMLNNMNKVHVIRGMGVMINPPPGQNELMLF